MISTVLPSTRPAFWLFVAGVVMLSSGFIHIPVAFVMEGDRLAETWRDTVSWRKPVLFGISTGLTALSLAWVLSNLRLFPRDSWLSPIVAVSFVVEVGFITMQQWRGVESHFNHSTFFDTSIDVLITMLVLVAFGYIIDLTVRSVRSMDGAVDIQLATRSGMVLLVTSCLLGVFIVVYGNYQKSMGNSPMKFGESGILKFPHGMAIHAIQLLPFCCWVMRRLGVVPQIRWKAIRWLTVSIAAMLFFSLVQTFSGRSRFEISWAGGCFLVVAGLSALLAVAAVLNSSKMNRGGLTAD